MIIFHVFVRNKYKYPFYQAISETGKDIAEVFSPAMLREFNVEKIPIPFLRLNAIIQAEIISKIHTFDANPIDTEVNSYWLARVSF